MIMMTESKLEDHIASNEWTFVDTKLPGTEAYESHIGILRVMFNLGEDPLAVTTLLSKDKTELWVKNSDLNWERYFPCKK